MPPSSPEVIGKYSVQRWIESGGMGDIYLARDPTLDRPVAIKLLLEGFDSQELRERFEREARVVASLAHPNILAVFDIGEQDGVPYLVSELLQGTTLRTRLRASHFSVSEALSIARQIADASWLFLVTAGLGYSIAAFAIFWVVGLRPERRVTLTQRVRRLI